MLGILPFLAEHVLEVAMFHCAQVHYSPNLHYSGQREEDEESLPGNSCCVVC